MNSWQFRILRLGKNDSWVEFVGKEVWGKPTRDKEKDRFRIGIMNTQAVALCC